MRAVAAKAPTVVPPIPVRPNTEEKAGPGSWAERPVHPPTARTSPTSELQLPTTAVFANSHGARPVPLYAIEESERRDENASHRGLDVHS
jgi:hypothetical protein